MSMAHLPAALRRRVMEAAHFRCGYCLTDQRVIGPLLEIDHIIPEAKGGTDDEENLWLACPLCNSHKGDRVAALDPESGATVPLFNPRRDRWRDHFTWTADGTVVRGLTATGRATVDALVMNHTDVVAARALWVVAGWHPPIDST